MKLWRAQVNCPYCGGPLHRDKDMEPAHANEIFKRLDEAWKAFDRVFDRKWWKGKI